MKTLIREPVSIPKSDPGAATARRAAPRCGVDLMDAIYKRQAMRWYAPHQIDPDQVRALIDAAIQAPSAANQQPWAFAVIQDPALVQRVSDRVKELTLARATETSPLWRQRALLSNPSFHVFYGAPTVILICGRKGTRFPANEDCFLAAQNLMLAAYGLGLGTCPIGFAREALNDPALKQEIGIGDDHDVVMPIAAGYAAEIPVPDPREEPRILAWS